MNNCHTHAVPIALPVPGYINDKHIICLIPTYYNGGDCTHIYYVDGTDEMIEQPIRYVMRSIAHHEGISPAHMKTSFGLRPKYTDPHCYGPHLVFAHLKMRKAIGRDTVYGLFNVSIPFDYDIEPGPTPDTCYIKIKLFKPILICQSVRRVKHKLYDALYEQQAYIRRFLHHMAQTKRETETLSYNMAH